MLANCLRSLSSWLSLCGHLVHPAFKPWNSVSLCCTSPSAWLPEFAKVAKTHKGPVTHLTFWFSPVLHPSLPASSQMLL